MNIVFRFVIFTCFVLAVFCLGCLFVSKGYNMYFYDVAVDKIMVENVNITNYTMCENKSIDETAFCLWLFVKPYYNYTIRSDEDRNWEDIKINGGDCYDYARFYERMGKELGFYTQGVSIKSDGFNHRITVISDGEGYCFMNLNVVPYCLEYELNKNNTSMEINLK